MIWRPLISLILSQLCICKKNCFQTRKHTVFYKKKRDLSKKKVDRADQENSRLKGGKTESCKIFAQIWSPFFGKRGSMNLISCHGEMKPTLKGNLRPFYAQINATKGDTNFLVCKASENNSLFCRVLFSSTRTKFIP